MPLLEQLPASFHRESSRKSRASGTVLRLEAPSCACGVKMCLRERGQRGKEPLTPAKAFPAPATAAAWPFTGPAGKAARSSPARAASCTSIATGLCGVAIFSARFSSGSAPSGAKILHSVAADEASGNRSCFRTNDTPFDADRTRCWGFTYTVLEPFLHNWRSPVHQIAPSGSSPALRGRVILVQLAHV